MKRAIRASGLALCLLAVGACKNVAPDTDQPATIIDADDASRAALQQTVNALLDTDVLLADDALTTTSLLIIERQIPRSIEGSPAQGRNTEAPVQFRLVTRGTDCILIDQRDGLRHLLENTACIAVTN